MKKIVFLHPAHWEQASGGAEIQISYLVINLKNLGHEIHYIFEDKGSEIRNETGIILKPLKKINIRKIFGERWFLYIPKIKNILKSIKPDIIYTRFYSSWSGVAARYAKNNNVMHIWAMASDNDVKKRSLNNMIIKPFNFVELYYANYSFKNATKIVTQCLYQNDEIKRRFKRESIYLPKVVKLTIKKNIRKNSKKIIIVWLANFKPLKRPEHFVELAYRFKNNKECQFIMIGRMIQSYEDLIKSAQKELDNFEYCGEMEPHEVFEVLLRSHILINTSIYEGFANTLIESWLNKVIVMTMNVNPDLVITNNKIGFVCPTIDDLFEKVKLVVNNEKIRNEISERSFKYAIENHSFENYLQKIRHIMNL